MSNPFSGMDPSLSERRRPLPPKSGGWGFSAGAAMFHVFTLAALVFLNFLSPQAAYNLVKIPAGLSVLGIIWSVIACVKEGNGFSYACLILGLLLAAGSFYLMAKLPTIGTF